MSNGTGKSQEEVAEDQQREIENIELAYQRVFSSKDGKIVLQDLAEICRITQTTFVPGDAQAIYINEGCRAVFLAIAQKINMEMTELYLKKKEGKLAPQS